MSESPELRRTAEATMYGRKAGAPQNELPGTFNAGLMVWRGRGVAIAATGFLVYSTGVEFAMLGRSAIVALNDERSAKNIRRGLEGSGGDDPDSLQFHVQGVPITPISAQYREHSFRFLAWMPIPDEGDVNLELQWATEGIRHGVYSIPGDDLRSTAKTIQPLW